ncbi:penicillin-binding transpeptidase domain-containing protein [Actinomadura flavalba]|uniref:penicillin-binding transpeptidase domain-containing protein n=1 Tax=Actinomadura flavalba TaxID=1120938 RepID=UPI000374EA6C|nr:penicillin-binding transpeptidase domain-containing protein [Actinomadura flavalba]
MRRGWIVVAVVAIVLVGAGGAFWFLRDRGPQENAERFLAAWTAGDYATVRSLTVDAPGDLDARLKKAREDMNASGQRYELASVKDDRASFTARFTLAGNREFGYTAALPVEKRDGEWRVVWTPALLYPGLKEGQRLRTARAWPDRADVLAADGTPLSGPGSAGQIAGRVGAIDAETAEKLGAPYKEGDPAGTDGLQQQFERRLAGTPALAVQIVEGEGKVVKTVQRFGGKEGEPLKTTIDARAQRAASAALADVDKNASLVAVRPSTGEIVAIANKPGGYNRALMGQYPPGSTFKVVTAAALVADGLAASTPVDCPATVTIGGRSFRNSEHEAFGRVPFREAFAHSCNTTFAKLSTDRLDQARLAQVAQQFGFGQPIIAGLPAVRGAFPATKDATALAAASFGQGEVLTSPLNMAGVAAAAASGTWRSPRVVDAKLVSEAADTKGRKPQPPRELEPKVRRALQTLMPAVVSEGTASGVDFPKGTAGKTGTAEYGSGENPPTHGWFIGYKSDLAFAVIVESGGAGATSAAPAAATFLRAAT